MKLIKIFFLFLVVIFISKTSFSQTERDNFQIGFGLGVELTDFRTNKDYYGDKLLLDQVYSGGIQPNFGYFVFDNLLVGAEIPISFTYAKNKPQTEIYKSRYSFFPYIKYYIGQASVKPYGQIGIGLGRFNTKIKEKYTDEENEKGSFFGANFSVGAGFFLSDSFSMDLGLKFNHTTEKLISVNQENRTINADKKINNFVPMVSLGFYFAF
ncbi:MAG: outer membrane protein [Bacteroidales bacterium]